MRGDIAHANDTCRACREYYCASYDALELNLPKLCFDNPDPKFSAECIAAKNCAYEKKCGYKRGEDLAQCLCGTVPLEDCVFSGRSDGPCKPELLAAGRTNSVNQLALVFGDLSLPIAVANFLQICENEHCPMCSKR